MNGLRFMVAKWPIIALLAFINLSVAGLVWLSLDSSYKLYQERAEITSRNTNRLVSQSVAGDIDLIDMALSSSADEVARRLQAGQFPRHGAMDSFLTHLKHRLPMADSIRITDANGTVVGGSGGIPEGVTIQDRDYFVKLRDKLVAGLAISQPVLGRVSGKWVLIFARRIESADGTFAGVVLAPVTVDWFERKFHDLEVGATGTVVLRGDASRDFDLLARIPHAGYVGQTKVSDTFRARITAKPAGDTYQAAAGADGIHRTFSYRPVGHYPLITLVGLATEDYLGEWRRESMKQVALAVAFFIISMLGGFFLLRAWHALHRRTEDLARSNADLEQFAYVSSHDLQTPLRNMSGYAQLLARRYKGRLDEDADDFIDFIVSGSQHMSQMITDLLEYARSSTEPHHAEEVDLAAIAGAVTAKLRPSIEAIGAEVEIGPLPRVMAEPRQMESLFQNLIDNALHYRHPDRPAKVSISAFATAKGMWQISISDNGIGIEPQYFDKIFVVFQRLDPQSHPNGTGIGLALCRRIVNRFGGTISVTSRPQEGSTFTFTLPAVPPLS